MNLDPVKALSDRLTGNAALTAFFVARYGKPALRFIGYNHVPNANNFPHLSFVMPLQKRQLRERSMAVSVVLGLREPDVTDGVFNGVEQSALAVELIESALTPLLLSPGLTISPNWSINSDLGVRHPFYETELQLTLSIRYPLQYHANQT